MLRVWLASFGAILVLWGHDLAQAQVRDWAPVEPQAYVRPAERVPLRDGRGLNFVCRGSGTPLVVLEAGAGQSARTWRLVQDGIATTTRVCAYDRAGYGHSDAAPAPRTAAAVVADLYEALGALHVREPVLLVGHSAGGLYSTLFADLHPHAVAGLVLIDPSFAGQHAASKALISPRQRALLESTESIVAGVRRCADLARVGRTAELMRVSCYAAPPSTLPAELQAHARQISLRPEFYEAFAAEIAGLLPEEGRLYGPSELEELVAAREFGSMPLIVFTAAQQPAAPDGVDDSASLASWRLGHQQLAARSTNGRSVLVSSGHFIQVERPELIVEAVRDAVQAVRSQPTHETER